MKLSTRSIYGLRALVELALAANREPLSASFIASRQELSVAYLEQLLHRLKQHGLVTSLRGPKGGDQLAKEPEQMTVAEIVQVLDGRAVSAAGRDQDANRHAQLVAEAVFQSVHERLARSLEDVTLQDVCDQVHELAGEPLEHRYVFHI